MYAILSDVFAFIELIERNIVIKTVLLLNIYVVAMTIPNACATNTAHYIL